ncbi:MAG: diguanylate cyclase [Planctomycetes bacterium]|nr:diguanylate cyclase [Planctomycetota bacterium]
MAQRTHLLVAHFDPAERTRIATVLRSAGAEVSEVGDGTAALAAAGQRPFDLALASCMLTGTSGFELCRLLAAADEKRATLPTVLIADGDDPYVRARARHVGAKRVLFGTPVAAQLTALLSADWEAVDPLELSSRDPASARNDRLFRDLIGAGTGEGDDSLIAKVTDRLTGLVQRDYLALKVEEECKRASRYGQPLALLAAEVVGYDQLVEKHGRATGDEALLEVAGVFLCESRDVDVAGRAAPARFQLLLPNTPADGARVVAQRILESLAGRTIVAGEREVAVTVRMGLALHPGRNKLSAEELVAAADADLASAQLSPDGRGVELRGGQPVEPLAGTPRKPSRAR